MTRQCCLGPQVPSHDAWLSTVLAHQQGLRIMAVLYAAEMICEAAGRMYTVL